MRFKVRFTQDAQADLERLYDFLLQQTEGDFRVAERALAAIGEALDLLETSPFSCRKAMPGDPFLRELIVSFGSSGYVALFEIEGADTVTVLAFRHQREEDYH